MVKVRFASSPAGSLRVGSAMSAVANRRFADERGGTMLLRIDDIDLAPNVDGGAGAIAADLEWLGVRWDEGPVHQSARFVRHREAAHEIGAPDADGAIRFGHTTLLRADGAPTHQLACAVDDVDFAITHVICGSDDRTNAELIRALGAEPPELVHHGLLLGEDGTTLADLRASGVPPEAVRTYLDELGTSRHGVHFDSARLRRLSLDALAALSDDDLAARVGVPVAVAPVLRGARDLVEAREYARQVLEPVRVDVDADETLTRFRELVEGGLDGRAIVRELKAVGGDLKSLRLALTGRERGPELAAVIAALPRDELLRRTVR